MTVPPEEDGRICVNGSPGSKRGVTVLIDNYDSFTFNIVEVRVSGQAVLTAVPCGAWCESGGFPQ